MAKSSLMLITNRTVLSIAVYSAATFFLGIIARMAPVGGVQTGLGLLGLLLAFSPFPGIVAFWHGVRTRDVRRALAFGGLTPLVVYALLVAESELTGNFVLSLFIIQMFLSASASFALMGMSGFLWTQPWPRSRSLRDKDHEPFRLPSIGVATIGLALWYLSVWTPLWSGS